ncbi:RHS repeat domain-containing protein [Pedobacter flavus]|uniref:RHS repeat-associated core domain-containing protein n=1 Tax=Pedobacter flavus TaxID=3113906 RepID=A0ABU7H145_9SPHI|nr:RHS repeat-associated core domain-containing protein [Pedobacter sp. VNH31]MEE1885058.1 RHS repeat-associated core domain-containing protein [Pedobacter sp. VNH31]
MGRSLAVKEKINAQDDIWLNRMEYNGIGQLKQKHLHSTNGSFFLQNTKYAYNERGWLKSNVSNEFSFKLGYDTLSTPQYNGNIRAQLWGSANSYPNQFLYSYDQINRLTNGTSTGIVMSEVLSYDRMGNIASLNRDAAGASTYSYTGNRLNGISGGSLTTGAYSYDNNGNAIVEGRLGVSITYNYLNLPVTASKSGLSIVYTYDATGNKLAKTSTVSPSTTVTTHYISGIQYTGSTIDFIQNAEGRALNNGGSFVYQYNLIDHLGNVRYSFENNGGAIRKLQQDDYYSFGLRRIVSSGTNLYLYNGKELQEELGQYDYGARFYDPVIGRFNTIDPLAEQGRRWSPYAYGKNNPIKYIDPDGMRPLDWYRSKDKSTIQWFEGSGEQEGFDHLFAAGKVTSSSDLMRNNGVNLNSDGTATDAITNEATNISKSGQTTIISKNNEAIGAGLSLNAGIGLFYQGLQISVGLFGPPGKFGQGYVSIATPRNPLFFDASVSAQVLVGSSTTDQLDLSGNGRSYGAGVGPISGTFNQGLNRQGEVTSNIYGFGPSIGAKYTGGGSQTKTFTFPIFIPKLFNPVGARF